MIPLKTLHVKYIGRSKLAKQKKQTENLYRDQTYCRDSNKKTRILQKTRGESAGDRFCTQNPIYMRAPGKKDLYLFMNRQLRLLTQNFCGTQSFHTLINLIGSFSFAPPPPVRYAPSNYRAREST